MKMKLHIVVLLGVVISLISLPSQVEAHVLKTDGSVGAVIHVSPEDDPIAGESTDFFFEFKDKSGKFNPQNCDCKGVIVEGGKEIYSAPLFQNSNSPSLESASFSYTFPQKDVYIVKVSGTPTTPDAFQPFSLEWDIRVARSSDTQTATDPTTGGSNSSSGSKILSYLPQILGISIIVIFIIIYFVRKKPSGEKKTEERG